MNALASPGVALASLGLRRCAPAAAPAAVKPSSAPAAAPAADGKAGDDGTGADASAKSSKAPPRSHQLCSTTTS